MKRLLKKTDVHQGFSLVEVTLALGLVSFVLVSIFGLLPVLFDSMRDSGERAMVTRVYQAVAEDLMNHPASPDSQRTYVFDPEGMLLSLSPQRDGGPAAREGEERFVALTATAGDIPSGAAHHSHLTRTTITISNTVTGHPLIRRAIWTTSDE